MRFLWWVVALRVERCCFEGVFFAIVKLKLQTSPPLNSPGKPAKVAKSNTWPKLPFDWLISFKYGFENRDISSHIPPSNTLKASPAHHKQSTDQRRCFTELKCPFSVWVSTRFFLLDSKQHTCLKQQLTFDKQSKEPDYH